MIISGLDGEGTVRTQLVDSGLILRAPLSSLVPLSTFSPALDAYPHQVSHDAADVARTERARESTMRYRSFISRSILWSIYAVYIDHMLLELNNLTNSD